MVILPTLISQAISPLGILEQATSFKARGFWHFSVRATRVTLARSANASTLDVGGMQFFQDNGYIFGRFPLTDLVTDQPMRKSSSRLLCLCGRLSSHAPRISGFMLIYFTGPNNSGYTAGVEYPCNGMISSVPGDPVDSGRRLPYQGSVR